jgi:hypothetical protein
VGTRHFVQQGEYLSLIAQRYGFSSWRTVYDHPRNASLRKLRPNPNVLFPGDQVWIPDRTKKEASAATETAHTFRLVSKKQLIRIALVDRQGNGIANRAYYLVVGSVEYRGQTSNAGIVEHPVAANAQRGVLTVWMTEDSSGPGITWEVLIGHLDPLEEVSGAKARLNNLGYDCGAPDDTVDERMTNAIAAFQEARGLSKTGKLDDATRRELGEFHDGTA